MKKLFVFIIVFLSAVSVASAQTCDCDSLQSQIDALTARIEALENGTQPDIPQNDIESSGDFEPVVIGEFKVEFLGFELKTAQYTGTEYIEIKYRFTNNSSESASFGWKIGTKAFQDGIELSDYIVSNSERTTEIRPQKSIEVLDSFKIRNKDSEIELEFTPFLAYKPDIITRILPIK